MPSPGMTARRMLRDSMGVPYRLVSADEHLISLGGHRGAAQPKSFIPRAPYGATRAEQARNGSLAAGVLRRAAVVAAVQSDLQGLGGLVAVVVGVLAVLAHGRSHFAWTCREGNRNPGRGPDRDLPLAVPGHGRRRDLPAGATPLTAAGRRPALTGPAAAGDEYEHLTHHDQITGASRWMS